MGWSPEQIELRDKLIDELAYVTREGPGGRISLECTLKVLTILGELGWVKDSSHDVSRETEDPPMFEYCECSCVNCSGCTGL